jgi:hypothetical protein
MVGLGGLEPPASPLSGVRSNHLSYRPGETEPQNLDQATWNNDVKYRCLVWTSCARELATVIS